MMAWTSPAFTLSVRPLMMVRSSSASLTLRLLISSILLVFHIFVVSLRLFGVGTGRHDEPYGRGGHADRHDGDPQQGRHGLGQNRPHDARGDQARHEHPDHAP